MIYCFDIDGTISERPQVFGPLMRSLLEAGHTVYPLTAMQSNGMDAQFETMRLHQLSSFGLEKGREFTDVVVVVAPTLEECGDLKGKFCKEQGVAFMVEDTGIYAASIKRFSPETLCLRMPNGL